LNLEVTYSKHTFVHKYRIFSVSTLWVCP